MPILKRMDEISIKSNDRLNDIIYEEGYDELRTDKSRRGLLTLAVTVFKIGFFNQ